MKPILSILLSAMSLSAFAQHSNPFESMPAHVQAIFEKQMSTRRAVYKTTGSAQRLIGYSNRSFPGNTLTDTMHASFSAGRGNTFDNAIDNLYAQSGGNGQPDVVWKRNLSSNYTLYDRVYLYDNQNHPIKIVDNKSQNSVVKAYDNSGNNITTKWYDTIGSYGAMTYKGTTYSFYDNQNRSILDSAWHASKRRSSYDANNIDSSLLYKWSSGAANWRPFIMDIDVHNNSGQMIFHYQFLGDTTTNSWNLTTRDSLVYDANGFVTMWIGQSYFNGSWINGPFNVTGYSGNNPIPNYLAVYSVTNNNVVWDYQAFFTFNSSGNWASEVYQNWNTATHSWWTVDSMNISYNADDLVSGVTTFKYDTAAHQYQASPSNVETYYYETYTPTAVTTIQTPSPEITAYPNPVSGKLHIDGNIGSKNVSLQLISITGVRLFSTSGNWLSMNKDIDMSAFASGVYYLLIADDKGNKIAAKQIVKN